MAYEQIATLTDVNSKYSKPASGIPSTDMATDVQTAIGAVSGKYEKPASGIPSTDLADAVQTSLGKADTALQEHQSLADYSTTAQMNTAIATAIGDAIGGAY